MNPTSINESGIIDYRDSQSRGQALDFALRYPPANGAEQVVADAEVYRKFLAGE